MGMIEMQFCSSRNCRGGKCSEEQDAFMRYLYLVKFGIYLTHEMLLELLSASGRSTCHGFNVSMPRIKQIVAKTQPAKSCRSSQIHSAVKDLR